MFSDAKEAAVEEMRVHASLYRNRVNGGQLDENCLAVLLVPLHERLCQARELFSDVNFRDWLAVFADGLEKMLIDCVVLEALYFFSTQRKNVFVTKIHARPVKGLVEFTQILKIAAHVKIRSVIKCV